MKIIVAIFLFFLTILLVGQNLDKPFWGEHDWNGVRYGNIARNYLRYGLVETKLGQVENSGFAGQHEFEYYTHYPPLLPILLSASYKLFGISEWSTRIVPLLTTAGSIVLIFLIGTTCWDFRRGLLAALLALATPLVLYFGKNPVHEPLTLFLIILSFWGYLNFQKTKQKVFGLIFVLGLILSQLTAWAGYFLIPAITIYLFIKRDWMGIKKIIPFWVLSIFLFIVHLVHIKMLTSQLSGGDLFGSLLQRTGLLTNIQPEQFNFINYLDRLRLWFSTLYTITLSLLVATWIVVNRKKILTQEFPIFVLGLIGLIYIIVFSSSVFIHNYLIFYFLPFMVLTGSWTIEYLVRFKMLRSVGLMVPLILIGLIFLERKNYLNALNLSSADKLAVDIGKSINKQTLPSDIILVSPIKYSYSAEKFLKFYSDRRLIFADDGQLDYDYMVAVNLTLGTFEIFKR